MFERLRAFLRHDPPPGSVLVPADKLDALEKRLTALEEGETTRSIQWAETRTALDRMLRRAAALQSVDRAKEEAENGGPGRMSREQLRATLKAKGYLREE